MGQSDIKILWKFILLGVSSLRTEIFHFPIPGCVYACVPVLCTLVCPRLPITRNTKRNTIPKTEQCRMKDVLFATNLSGRRSRNLNFSKNRFEDAKPDLRRDVDSFYGNRSLTGCSTLYDNFGQVYQFYCGFLLRPCCPENDRRPPEPRLPQSLLFLWQVPWVLGKKEHDYVSFEVPC